MQVTSIECLPIGYKESYLTYKSKPLEQQRFAFFGGKVHGYHEVSRKETDTHVYWVQNSAAPKWNSKSGLYLRNTSSQGATYDKATKKFKWWYGKQMAVSNNVILKDMCDYFKAEWFNNAPINLKISTTNSTLSKVLLGKITNPRDLIKGIIKVNPTLRNLNISTELVWRWLNSGNSSRIQALGDMMSVAKDPNHVLEFILDGQNNYMHHELVDLSKQAQMLGRKIDFKWSMNRMKEVHNEWTIEIMDMEQDYVDHKEYNYKNELPNNGCLELITNSKELYIEGRIMSHCVYTNYADTVSSKTYFVFKFTDRDTRATLGITKGWNSDNFVINQMYGKRNATIDQCHHDYIKEWLAKPEVQQWFKDNYKTN
jgi:hypothetical protein